MIYQTSPKSKREWHAVIGIDNQSFRTLVSFCEETYYLSKKRTFEESLISNPRGKIAKIKSIEDLIFFTLGILKSGITFDFAAYLLQFDQSRAYRQFINGLNLINDSLEINGYVPIRNFNSINEFEIQFNKKDPLIFDATEQKIQRSQEVDFQKETYSGKKKGNTVKSMIISTLDKYIHYISECYVGKTHDFSLLKSEFDPTLNWFEDYQIRVDLGYQGFEKEYPKAILFIPKKKPKGGELTQEQILLNKELATQRIKVEHSIAGIKRYDILSTTCRIHDFDIYNKMLGTCAGLWNFYITS